MQELITVDRDKNTVAVTFTVEQIKLLDKLINERLSPIVEDYEGYPPTDLMPLEFSTSELLSCANTRISTALELGYWEGLE